MTIGFQDGQCVRMELFPHSPDLYLVLARNGIHNNVRPCQPSDARVDVGESGWSIMVSERGRLYVTTDLHPHSIYGLMLSHL
jgi:hypothetical protein